MRKEMVGCMSKGIMAIFSVVVLGCSSPFGREAQTGHLIVSLKDINGNPITNATVTVKALNRTGINAGIYESHFTRTSAVSDSEGVADVAFQFLVPTFDWFVYTPSHHCARFISEDAYFPRNVVNSDYLNIDTNTVDGISKYNELKALDEAGDVVGFAAKFEPKSVTYVTNIISRAVSFYPKRNPQPMYAHDENSVDYKRLPTHSETIMSNGVEYVKYDDVDFDLKEGAFLPPWGGRNDHKAGKVSDFKIVGYSVATNGVTEFFGWLEFAPGCGAYKRKKTGDPSFPSTYEADTNAVFLSRIPYRSYRRDGESKYIAVDQLLPKDEYMVLRTRVMVDEDTGSITNCHYSKILGRMRIGRDLSFEESIFNPIPNDTNLEHDLYSDRLGTSGSVFWP